MNLDIKSWTNNPHGDRVESDKYEEQYLLTWILPQIVKSQVNWHEQNSTCRAELTCESLCPL